ncbi:hypothetical protein ACHAXT_008036 [Thalassiosira profunda]
MPSASEDAKQTHYAVLQIPHAATPEEIKAAYRTSVVRFHPDKVLSRAKENGDCKEEHIISDALSGIDIDDEELDNDNCNGENSSATKQRTQREKNIPQSTNLPDDANEEQSSEQRAFHRIQAAYQCLRDPEKRRQYDESISRKEDREEWRRRGASEVKLSEMESDWCCVVDDDNSSEEGGADEAVTKDEDAPLQKVYFYPLSKLQLDNQNNCRHRSRLTHILTAGSK